MSESKTYYVGDLGDGQQVCLEHQEQQTLIALSGNVPGQSQSQSSSLQTGEWIKPPALFKTSAGFILRIEADRGQTFVQLQANRIQPVMTIPSLADADIVPLRRVSRETAVNSMPSMSPMQPMKLGDMEMQMNPMQMRMGNMELKMGDASPQSENAAAQKRFCSKCGQPIETGDRFCSYCGHQLS